MFNRLKESEQVLKQLQYGEGLMLWYHKQFNAFSS